MLHARSIESKVANTRMNGYRAARGKIRICYVITAIDTPYAGTEGHLLRLINRLDKDRFDPHLFVLRSSACLKQPRICSIPVHILGFRSFKRLGDWLLVASFARKLRRLQPHIVELYFSDAHFLGTLAGRLAGVPVVISCRRDIAHHYGRKELYLTKLANPLVTHFLANCQAVADRISELEGVEKRRFLVIQNGVDLAEFDKQARSPVPIEFEDSCRGKHVVCLAANLRPVKNIPMFLHAARTVLSRRDDVLFAILGAGEEEQRLKSLATDLNIGKHIHWCGSVRFVAPYLRRSNICCLTSNAEGFSNAIVEYMAAGKPVVATDVGGIGEAVIEGETGYLVDKGDFLAMGDRLHHLLSNKGICEEFGAAGRLRVERQFSFTRQLDSYQNSYNSFAPEY